MDKFTEIFRNTPSRMRTLPGHSQLHTPARRAAQGLRSRQNHMSWLVAGLPSSSQRLAGLSVRRCLQGLQIPCMKSVWVCNGSMEKLSRWVRVFHFSQWRIGRISVSVPQARISTKQKQVSFSRHVSYAARN